MTYGYIRVSTTKQNLERQRANITNAYGTIPMYQDKCTGKKIERPQWNKLMSVVKSGDTIVFDEVSRMSRDTEEGIAAYFDLYDKGINLVFIKDPTINTEVYKEAISTKIEYVGNEIADTYIKATNEVLRILARNQVKIAFDKADAEGKFISQRTKEGLKVNRATEKMADKKTNTQYNKKQFDICQEIILKYSKSFNGNLAECDTLTRCNNALEKNKIDTISKATYFRYKLRLSELLENA